MTRDDLLRDAFLELAAEVEGQVRRPPARVIMQRAGLVEGAPRRTRKPFPLAGVIGIGALPLVAVGGILVYPAAGEMLSDHDDQPDPPAITVTQTPAGTTSTPTPTVESPSTVAQAVTPMVKVYVYFSDETVVGEACSRLIETTRLVDESSPVLGAVEALVEGPQPEEEAVGYAAPLAVGAGTVAVDEAARTVTLTVPDAASLAVGCGQQDLAAALEETVAQFDGWTANLVVAGVPVPLPQAALPEDAEVEATDPAATADLAPGSD